MLFAVTVTYTSGDVGKLAQRFAKEVEKGELSEDMTMVTRYHSPITKWACMIIETDSAESLHLWAIKYNDLADFEVHPVVTEEKMGPVVEEMLARHQ